MSGGIDGPAVPVLRADAGVLAVRLALGVEGGYTPERSCASWKIDTHVEASAALGRRKCETLAAWSPQA
jgi:hypothetical protein